MTDELRKAAELVDGWDSPTPEDNDRDKFWCAAILSILSIDDAAKIFTKACELRKDPEVRKFLNIQSRHVLSQPDGLMEAVKQAILDAFDQGVVFGITGNLPVGWAESKREEIFLRNFPGFASHPVKEG